MKRIVLTTIALILTIVSFAENLNVVSAKPTYAFNAQGLDLSHSELKDYPDHYLGDVIARKNVALKSLYVRRNHVSIGFSNSSVEIVKPAIYNSVNKIDSYLKKCVTKDVMTEEEAMEHLSKCLDVAYVAYYEDTEEMEVQLRKTKDMDQMIAIFEGVKLE